jgi:hypothetical protein
METRWAGAGASIRHEAIGPEPEECVEQALNSATSQTLSRLAVAYRILEA